MERNAFKLLHDLESSWWYRGRADVVRHALSRAKLSTGARILDFGAGYGGMRETLARYGTVSAYEPNAEAQQKAGERGYEKIYADKDEALKNQHDLIGLFDVLEHIPDDQAFLREAHGALSEKGMLTITVPAMPFLWSQHDVSHHHHRRYTPETLRSALNAAGYDVVYLSYWNMLLFPVAAVMRLLGRTGETSFSIPRFADAILYALVCIEVFLMRFISLPFGISLIALARKR